MLPPGWEDLDRYVDLLFCLAHPLSALILAPPPLSLPSPSSNLPVGVFPFIVERSCQYGEGILDYFHFRKYDTSGALTWHRQMGQLFMMGFDGTSVNPQIRSLIENYHLGAVLLSAKNLKCIFFKRTLHRQ